MYYFEWTRKREGYPSWMDGHGTYTPGGIGIGLTAADDDDDDDHGHQWPSIPDDDPTHTRLSMNTTEHQLIKMDTWWTP
jgi:hypothetical protein